MRIKEKPNAILCPLIESIDKTNLAYLGNGGSLIIYYSLVLSFIKTEFRKSWLGNIYLEPFFQMGKNA